MKKITVSAAWASRYMGDKTVEVELPPDASYTDAALTAGIPRDEIGIITRGGETVNPGAPAEDGEIKVYPVIIGG